jgi:16S rRNA (cytosine1402-N4)-methyltransferase
MLQAHIPVLLDEVVSAVNPQLDDLIVDGTFGAGGYSSRILEHGARVIGIDRDPDVIAAARSMLEKNCGRLKLWHGCFSDMGRAVEGARVDAIMLDIGVSSMQIDEGRRGFSFLRDGPLDMRMAQEGVSAADVIHRTKVNDLNNIATRNGY